MSAQEMIAVGGEPLPVEFWHGGAWYPGVLLGWRHEADGSCRLRVQFVVGGLRRSSWLALTDLRLAEPRPMTGPVPVPVPTPRRDHEALAPVPG